MGDTTFGHVGLLVLRPEASPGSLRMLLVVVMFPSVGHRKITTSSA
jgi:hypothetical protein